MSAVSLIGAMSGTQADSGAGGRATGDSGALFGEALTAAGQLLDGTSPQGRQGVAGADEQSGDGESTASDSKTSDSPVSGAARSDIAAGDVAAAPALNSIAVQLASTAPVVPSAADGSGAQPDSVDSGASLGDGVEAAGESLFEPLSPAQGIVQADAAEQQHARSTDAGVLDMVAAASANESPRGSAPTASAAQGLTVSSPLAESIAIDTSSASPAMPVAGAVPFSVSAAAATSPAPASVSAGDDGASATALAPVAGSTVAEEGVRGDSAERTPAAQPAAAAASVVPAQPAATPVTTAAGTEPALTANRAVAAQVAPVVVSIAQRPTGTHHLTMTVNPDSLGPVTVRAHISATGEVQVELSGATDAGREALRGILIDLRRDLASVMPHATLSVAQGAASETASERGGQPGTGDPSGEQGAGDRDANRGRAEHRAAGDRGADLPTSSRPRPTPVSAGVSTSSPERTTT